MNSFHNFDPASMMQTVFAVTIVPLVINYSNTLIQKLPNLIKSWLLSIFDFSPPKTHSVSSTVYERTINFDQNELYRVMNEFIDDLFQNHKDFVTFSQQPFIELNSLKRTLIFRLEENQQIGFEMRSSDWNVVAPKQQITDPDSKSFSIWKWCCNKLLYLLHNLRIYKRFYDVPQKDKHVDPILKVYIKSDDGKPKDQQNMNQTQNQDQASQRNDSTIRKKYQITIEGTNDEQKLFQWFRELINLYKKENKKTHHVYMIDPYGSSFDFFFDWQLSFDNLLLTDSFRNEIRNDFKDFWNNQQRCIDVGQPFRRGYFLVGPPGTGKSSFIKCLQNEYPLKSSQLDIFVMQLSSSNNNNQAVFRRAKQLHKNHSVWIIEDIDCIGSFLNERTELPPNPTPEQKEQAKNDASGLSSFLNAIDGIDTPEGLMIIFTSNHPAKLDSALTRPGRIDRIWDFGPVYDPPSISSYFSKFKIQLDLPKEFFEFVQENQLTPAFIIQIFTLIRNRYQSSSNAKTDFDLMQITKKFVHERKQIQSKEDVVKN